MVVMYWNWRQISIDEQVRKLLPNLTICFRLSLFSVAVFSWRVVVLNALKILIVVGQSSRSFVCSEARLKSRAKAASLTMVRARNNFERVVLDPSALMTFST